MSVIRRRSAYAHERNITFSHSLHVVVCSSDSSLQMLFPDYFVYTCLYNCRHPLVYFFNLFGRNVYPDNFMAVLCQTSHAYTSYIT